jgi:Asp-tRNA(Asn)/Glu-tRNA(Gln) amidotransferase A subunit family amidase
VKPAKAFHLLEATIDEIHTAIKTRQITCTRLVQLYLDRIEAYSGKCTAYRDEAGNTRPPDLLMPSGKAIELATLTAIENAGQLNAFSNLNVRGLRSETDLADTDPGKPDALETAAALDAKYGNTLSGPLHCIPFAIKDQVDTYDMRTTDAAVADYTNDRPPRDAELVRRLRAAGAIILGKANMGEYAGGTRSTYQGQVCNPYATDRGPGGSSAGSGASVAANLVTCAIAEESLGSIRNPASMQGIVGFAQTRGLVSREGNFRANLIRERLGPHCRTVKDTAIVLGAIAGYDPGDPITAVSVGQIPLEGYAVHATKRTLAGKRIGVLRELMTRFSVADENSIALMNQAIADMSAAGGQIVESINDRDCVLFGACGDPAIPDMSPTIQAAIEELLPYLEPSFVGPPATATAPAEAWPVASRIIPSFALPPAFANFMAYIVGVFFDHSLFPHSVSETAADRVIDLRRLAGPTPPGAFGQGKYTFNRYLKKRGDATITSVADLNEIVKPCTQAAFETGGCGKGRAIFEGKNPPNDTATQLDTPGEAAHLFRQQALREIILHVMAANRLDALVYPHHTIPSAILFNDGAATIENRPAGGWNALTDVSGLPDMVMPAGFTSEAYDVADCTAPGAITDPGAPTGKCLVRNAVELPFSMSILGRPFDEAGIFEIASAYEYATQQRKPPADFGPLAGEP